MRMIVILVPVVAVLIAWASVARAQQGANIDLQTFQPAMDSRGYITVNASQVLGHKEVSFGLVTNWGHSLLRFENGANTYEVENILTPTLVGALGLRLGKVELELGISAPFSIMSGDRGPDSDGGTPDDPNDDETFSFEGQGLGDLGLHAKLRLLNTSRGARIGVALVGSAYLPTATQTEAWIGQERASGRLGVVLDREIGRVRMAANAGFHYRAETRFEDVMTGVPMTGRSISVGSGLPFGAGLAYAVSKQKFDVVAELIGEVPLVGEHYLPLEALAGIKVYLARNSFLMLGGGAGLMPSRGGNPDFRAFLGIVFEPSVGDRDGDGIKDDVDMCPDDPEDFDDFEDEDGCPDPDNDQDGILDVDDQCPNEPENFDGFEDEDGCPEVSEFDRDGDGIPDHLDACPDEPEDMDGFEDEDGCPDPDNDGDGILDIDDLCPDEPEDFDGFEDEDGCPDPDNDRDGILDVDDQCPGVDGQSREETAETWNGYQDEDGCPDRDRVYFDDGKLVALESIHFEYNSATIKPISFSILDAIATTLELNPDITRIEVQGHTDERGSDEYNLRLSQARAESVVAYLAGKGVAKKRLTAQGYGERVPLDRRRNEKAWAKNRRVEFLIMKRAGER